MSDTSSASGSSAAGAVHLGFSLPIESPDDIKNIAHNSPIWSDWDGGKIGGDPSWLNPRDLPIGPLRCKACAKRNELAAKAAPPSETRDGKSNDTPSPSQNSTIMRFLCQTYCPADAESTPPNAAAFHRTLYVFACPSIECSTNPTPDSVLVIRSQLPKDNDFYPRSTRDREDDFDDWDKHKSNTWDVNLCTVCGCKAGGRCPKQNLWFCGREHQKEHLKHGNKRSNGIGNKGDKAKLLPSVYTETELVVEDEPSVKKTTEDDEERLRQEMDKVAMFSSSDEDKKKDDAKSSGDDDEELDENLEQTDLNDMTGAAGTGTSDTATLEFYSRIGRGNGDVKDQCLRYCRWKEGDNDDGDADSDSDENNDVDPLWVSSRDVLSKDAILPCQYCGAPRKFELQLMPQMLSYLFGGRSDDKLKDAAASEEVRAALLAASNIAEQAKQEGREGELPADFKKRHDEAVQRVRNTLLLGGTGAKQGGDGMDWGTIAVYTCTASCGDGKVVDENKFGAYREEFAWRQQSLGV